MRIARSVCVLLLIAVAGCGLTSGVNAPEGKRSDMNMQEAAERADAIVQQTIDSVRPQLRWNHGPSNDKICTDFKNDTLATGSVKRRAAIMTVVSRQRRGSLLGVVERAWKSRGYEITSVDTDEELPAIYAATPEGFRLSVAVAGEGQFFFSITTPCFAKSDVADPKTQPNTPHRDGGYPQRPDVHDDFWSAATPPPPPT